MHAAGERRSRATGSSFGMNSRAPQRADELAGADPANRAPLAHPRQLAGRSWPRVRRRGARFGDGLETDHLNGRPGGREATRCAVRPLRGAREHQSIGHPGQSTHGFDTTVRPPSHSLFSLGRLGPRGGSALGRGLQVAIVVVRERSHLERVGDRCRSIGIRLSQRNSTHMLGASPLTA